MEGECAILSVSVEDKNWTCIRICGVHVILTLVWQNSVKIINHMYRYYKYCKMLGYLLYPYFLNICKLNYSSSLSQSQCSFPHTIDCCLGFRVKKWQVGCQSLFLSGPFSTKTACPPYLSLHYKAAFLNT